MTLLHVTDGYNEHKYYIDGRRVKRDVWHDEFNKANRENRLNSSYTKRKNSAWYHYVHA